MNPREDYTYYLMTRKLVGDISLDEEEELQQYISGSEDVKRAWEQLQQNFDPKDIDTKFERYRSWDWKHPSALQSQARARSRRKVINGCLAAAGIIGIILFFQLNSQRPPVNQVAKKASPSILLKLQNGQVIDLSQPAQNINAGAAILNNNNNTLSYLQAVGGSSQSSMNRLNVPVGMDYHVILSDGSEVWLNSATTFEFPFSFTGGSRNVNLNGEAYITVAKDAERPFFVHTSSATVKVLGTSFNINTYDTGVVRVALAEGAVHLQTSAGETPIKPGFEAVSTFNKLSIKKFDHDEVLGWRTGKYYFTEATLSDIMQVLPRWYGLNVKIENAEMKTDRFTGMVNKNRPVTVFLEKLKKAIDFEYYFDREGMLHIK